MITAAATLRPSRAPLRRAPLRRAHRLAAAAVLVAGLSIPVTGAGSAIAASHAPSLASTIAVTSALVPPFATGKNDV